MDEAKALARQLLDGTEDERLAILEEIKERQEHLRVLNDFAVSLISLRSAEDLFWYVAKEVVGRLGFVDCVVYELDPDRQVLIQRAAIGEKNPDGREIVNLLEIPVGSGITGRVAQNKRAEIIDDLLADEDYLLDIEQGRSEICVPLMNGEEVLGVIDSEDPRPAYFTQDHLETLTAVAALASSKLTECRAVKKIEDQAHVLENVREAVVMAARDGTIIDMNDGAVRMYGYVRDEFVGKGIGEYYADLSSWERLKPHQSRDLEQRGSWRGNVDMRTKAGDVITIDLSLTAIYKDGEWTETIGVARDITQLVASERAIWEKNQALQEKQAELERALLEGEEARRANRAKDAFLANTSHELRTPLTGVIGTIELLQETELSDEQQELIGAASTSARTLLAIIDDVLDLAKIEAGKIELQVKPFDAVLAVRSVAEALRQSAERKGLAFHVRLPAATSLFLIGDASRIRQILFNVIGNAVKFTQEGNVTVTMTAERQGVEWHLTVQVADTGIGFKKEDADKLFGRFEQLDASATKVKGGTGLGLAISRELAELMGGTLKAWGQEGVGATFHLDVTLPSAPAPHSGAARQRHEDVPVASQRLKIFVAEDNSLNQLLITKILGKFPWDVTVAENGAELLGLLEKGGRPDAILMDIRMPVMGGMEATAAIRDSVQPFCTVPIIALTANTLDSDRKNYLDAGMQAVVGKPIDVHELLSAIDAVASAPGARDS